MNDTAQPQPPPPPAKSAKKKTGFLNPQKVKGFAFFVMTLCILIAVLASILAIWEFADDDGLWRTIATCVVVAGGTGIFAMVNQAFGSE